MRARIFLADDHSLLLDAFSKLLEPEYDIVGTATDGRMMLKMVSKLAPDLVHPLARRSLQDLWREMSLAGHDLVMIDPSLSASILE